VKRHLITAARQLVAEEFIECFVAELCLLQADDIGPALVQPRQQARHPP
jgi:hypothetical protein